MNMILDLNVPLEEEAQAQQDEGLHEEEVHAAHPFDLNVQAQEVDHHAAVQEEQGHHAPVQEEQGHEEQGIYITEITLAIQHLPAQNHCFMFKNSEDHASLLPVQLMAKVFLCLFYVPCR